MIIQVANAVSDDDCRLLMRMYDRQVHLATIRDQTGHPVVYWDQLRHAPGAPEIVPRLVEECLCSIFGQLQLADPLYPETVILAAIGAGGCHSRHADNCRQSEQGDWVANHTPQRDVSAIYYLNDEFDGGEIVFDTQQWWSSRAAGFCWPFPATPPMSTRFCPCAAVSDTRCQFGSQRSKHSHWPISRHEARRSLVFRPIQMIPCNDRPSLSSRRRPGPRFAMGTGRSLSSGRPEAGPVGRCDKIFDAGHWSPSQIESSECI